MPTIRREEDNQDRFFRMNGEPAVMMQVARLPGADAIKTAARVRAALAEIQPKLPPGVRFQVVGDESVRLGEQLDDLGRRGGIAFLAVSCVLVLALQAPRAVLLVMASAAVAIAGTTLGLYLLDVPANLLTLAGLGMGIGILVQNGLVVVDRFRTVPDTPAGRARRQVDASRPPMLGSTLTTGVVLIPFLYLQGDTRAAFTPFAVAFSLALGCSILSSLVMLPAIGAGHGMHVVRWPRVRRAYLHTLILLLRWRWATIVGTLLVLGGSGLGLRGESAALQLRRVVGATHHLERPSGLSQRLRSRERGPERSRIGANRGRPPRRGDGPGAGRTERRIRAGDLRRPGRATVRSRTRCRRS